MTLIRNVSHGGPTLRRVTLACSVMLALGTVGGCAAARMNPAESAESDPTPRPVTFAIHLAYDEEQPGHQLMISRLGEQVYVAPDVALNRSDLEVARALHSQERHMLQLVFNYTGRRALEALTRAAVTRANVRPIAPEHGLPGVPGRPASGASPTAKTPPRLAVLINGELICAPYIDRPVVSGEIWIADVFSWQESEDLAAGLNVGRLP
ncbi:MAG: hypothetical protein GX547_06340 [Phycisphaerae bacterium]|nr:hypothetical protein [Phycisphaerae bacterium]